MAQQQDWIKQILTELRKLDRSAQRSHLLNALTSITVQEQTALRHEIEARRSRVQQELRVQQGSAHPDASRKAGQKEAMIARYNWLLHILDHYESMQLTKDTNTSPS